MAKIDVGAAPPTPSSAPFRGLADIIAPSVQQQFSAMMRIEETMIESLRESANRWFTRREATVEDMRQFIEASREGLWSRKGVEALARWSGRMAERASESVLDQMNLAAATLARLGESAEAPKRADGDRQETPEPPRRAPAVQARRREETQTDHVSH